MKSTRITVEEICERLDLGERAVYDMLKEHIIPGTRFGHRWLIARFAYEQWEKTFQAPKPQPIGRLA